MAMKKQVSTLQELVDNAPKMEELCGNGDSHLLIVDEMNPGQFIAKPLYDYSDQATRGGQFVCDIHEGPIALHGDTLILWK